MNKVSAIKIVLLSTSSIGVIFLIILFAFDFSKLNWVEKLLLAIGFLMIVTIIEFFFVKILFTNKIRSIYASIKNLSPSRAKRVGVSMTTDVITKAEEDTNAWVENRAKEIESLKEQEEFRRDFIGNLAHELKTPLFNIQGYVLTLLEGGLEDESINRNFLEKAAKNVDRLTGLVEDLDIITAIESARITLDIKPFSLLDLVCETIDMLRLKSEEKKITLRLKKNYENPFMVEGDKAKIQQVIENLISNAINYGQKKGEVVLAIYASRDMVTLEVEDNGVGINEEELNRIFERFYRIEKSRSNHTKGTGLGLAIVKHLLEAHNQQIMVSSELGKGSIFSFSLKKVS